jgi:pyruvate, water dikinase
MSESSESLDRLLHDLRERAKELNCLYEFQELLNTKDISIDEICHGILRIIPPGWQYPDVCQVEVEYAGKSFRSPRFVPSPWVQRADIVVQDQVVGKLSIYYAEERPASDEGPFLKEERRLIDTIAEQFGFFILHEQLKQVFQQQLSDGVVNGGWTVVFDLLRRTDPDLLIRLSRKMIYLLGKSGIEETEQLLERISSFYPENTRPDENRPSLGPTPSKLLEFSDEVFSIASKHLSRNEILDSIQKWSREDRLRFFVNVLVNPSSSLAEISSAIERYHLLTEQGVELDETREKWFRIALIRRLLSDEPDFVQVAKQFIRIDDFTDFMRRVIFPAGSHGKLGGKSSGLFLAAQVLQRAGSDDPLLNQVKTPKTCYLTSDSVFHFISHNDLEDIIEQKYRDLNQVRQEYPFIIQLFKNSPLPPDMLRELSLVLDRFNTVPLIVRSSSLLEDQTGAAFAGKYKSLFIANLGSREERLAALVDAINEVFASLFSPDPIEYRIEHGLIDYHEEMGILIQEVVGNQVGDYYLPSFAGVAFSHNNCRWSSRIRRDDGLVRLVPGLGTRAVDRLTDDYPVLVAPGQPGLRVNTAADEILRYSPKKIDLINLKTRRFETVDLHAFLSAHGKDLPLANHLISVLEGDHFHEPFPLGAAFERDDYAVTFDGLFNRTDFLQQVIAILHKLEQIYEHPIDIEFAHNGTDFYLLQCRAQSYREENPPALIPTGIPENRVVFSANRYISNGGVLELTHIVYVNPEKYAELSDHQDLLTVGRVIGQLNQILPRRKFILMGPGRWGSRGDIRLGVSVGYSDINNTAMLIEIARRRDNYPPEPSFGTHFFQDLVEASIHYLPLYPDEAGIQFNEQFLLSQRSILCGLLPDYQSLAEVVRVIDVPAVTNGLILQAFMNPDTEEALAILAEPG